MRRNLAFLTAALFLSFLALAYPIPAHAGAQIAPSIASPANSAPALLQLAGYYSDGYNDDDYDGGYRHKYYRRYHQKRYYDQGDDYYERRSCGYKRWKRKYVCDEPYPRCFKQRECIWHYGREYCTYVRKCVGGQQYCHWKSVPSYRSCDDYNDYD
jgi:hypothetical protein